MSLWSIDGVSGPEALLALLVAGHLLADFLLQTREGVKSRARGRGYLSHALAVFATHLLLLVPLLSPGIVLLVLVVAVLHLTIDWVKWNLLPRRWRGLTAFALDQAAHLAVLLLGWGVVVHLDAVPDLRWLSPEGTATYVAAAVLASAFAFNATGGSVIVAGVLERLSLTNADEDTAGHDGAGRAIGILERTLTLALILYGEWGAMGLLIAAKSIARFEEIKVRRFAEYYLIGTLTSLLIALAIGVILMEVVFP